MHSLIHNAVDPELIRFRHYPLWFQNFLLKMFPDMYKYRDPKSSTHPFKFGHDYYLYLFSLASSSAGPH